MSAPPTHVGKYQLLRKLAVGGMAEVYLARAAGPMGFEKTLVLKRILPHLAENPTFVQMFLGEARLAARMNHPNIVQIFDLGEAEGSYFIAMEFIDGPNLRALVKKSRSLGRDLPLPHCAKLASYACEGLAYAHDFHDPKTGEHLGLIHRDISPDNILVSANGAVKVVDFGIAKAADQTHVTKTGVLKGKVAYMAPEQLRGEELDRRADVFALGMVLYGLITGLKPFEATSEVSIMQAILNEPLVPVEKRRPDVPDALRKVISKALEKRREDRYPDCREMQADLERYIVSAGDPVGPFQLSTLVKELATGQAPETGEVGTDPAAPPAPSTPSKIPPGTGATEPAEDSLVIDVGTAVAAAPAPLERASASGAATEPAARTQADATAATLPAGSPAAPPVGAMTPSASPAPDLHSQMTSLAELEAAASPVPLTAPKRKVAKRRPFPWPVVLGAVVLLGVGGFFLLRGPGGVEVSGPATPEPATPEPATPEPATPEAAAPEPASPEAATTETPTPDAATPTTRRPRKPRRPKPAPTPSPTPAPATPKLATLRVESTPPAQVKLGGRFVGTTPVTLTDAKPGSARLEVYDSRVGFRETRTVELTAGDNGVQRFVGKEATLEFRIRPYAKVFLNGKALGTTPFAPVKVYAGKHKVRLVNDELGKDVALDFDVKAGANVLKKKLGD